MPYTFNPDTRDIVQPVGDTLDFAISVTSDVYHAVVFAIYDRSQGTDLLCVPAEIIDGVANIRLATAHTRDLAPGRYKWNLRLVEDPEYDDDGNIKVEDASDDVLTVFGPEKDAIPNIRLVRNGGRV